MSEWDYSWDYGGETPYEDWRTGGNMAGWDQFTGWGAPTGPGTSGDTDFTGEGSGGWLQSVLGSLGGLSGVLGPALSAGGALAGGAIGSNAANDAARLQADAANRGLDIQTAMWLQNLERQAPWLQAGREALPQLQQLAGQQPPGAFQGPPSISGQGYALPQIAPTWGPQDYQGPQSVQAGDYRWTPGQGPQAQNYRYTPGATPDAAAYRYTPGAVPTLSGQELLANDPGVQFRMDEGRKALEASAAARGGLLSGPTLAALQRQGQELSSQEYGNAWNRASQQAQLREQWGQAESQMGWQQAEAASRLREQVNQIASQQGWSQAQAEAAFREGQAQLASQQGWTQALQGQQNQYAQGLDTAKWNQQQRQAYDQSVYDRMMQQSQTQYGRDTAQNAVDYDRMLAAYNSQQQNHNTQWNRLAALSGTGQTAVNQLGTGGQNNATQMSSILSQLGNAQAGGQVGGANSWLNALQNIGGAVQGGLQNNALLSALSNLNR